MQARLNMNQLAARIMQDRSTLRDFIGGTTRFHMTNLGDTLILNADVGSEPMPFGVRPLAHEQIAEKVGIPFKYYERMRAEKPDLLAHNVNTWFQAQPANRLVRTVGGSVRAFLSDSYRPLDNFDVAENILPKLIELKLEVVSAEITETRLYIQARDTRIQGEVKVGDVVQNGVVITNSEVGRGSLYIAELMYRLRCLNGMVGEDVVRKAHVGGARRGDISFTEEVFKTDTRNATDRAFWMQAVEKLVEVLQLTQAEGSGILNSLCRGGDLSQWGLANAVTAQAHTTENYDRAFEFEQLGTRVIELPRSTFENN